MWSEKEIPLGYIKNLSTHPGENILRAGGPATSPENEKCFVVPGKHRPIRKRRGYHP
jgi:hypothetical protein